MKEAIIIGNASVLKCYKMDRIAKDVAKRIAEERAKRIAVEEAKRIAEEEAQAEAKRIAEEKAIKRKQESIITKRRSRIKNLLDAGSLTKLNDFFEQFQDDLENQMDEGEIPVVGWANLLTFFEECEGAEDIENNLHDIEQQINSLLQKKENLEQKLFLKTTKDAQSLKLNIEKLKKKEKEMIEQFNGKIDNFQILGAQDVSTLFSLFSLDHLFTQYQVNESKIPNFKIVDAQMEILQSELGLELNDALEMFSKFQLAKEGHKSFDDHFSNCGICSNQNIVVLLQEYGADLNDEEINIIRYKTKGWKSYFLISDPRTIFKALNLTASLSKKVAGAVRKIKSRHH